MQNAVFGPNGKNDVAKKLSGTVRLTVPDNLYNKYFLGIPILQQALFYSFVGDTMKQENLTPDNAFETIAKNFTGDSGMNINLLKEAINMKYCKILTATKE